MPPAPLRLVFLVALTLVLFLESSALVCESEDAAFAVFLRAAQQSASARFVMRGRSVANVRDLLTNRLHLIQSVADHDAALATAGDVGDDDAYVHLYATAWRDGIERVMYRAEGAAGGEDVVDCTALAATFDAAPAPPEVRELVHVYVENQMLEGMSDACAENEVALWDAGSGEIECSCAEGFTCSAVSNDELLLYTVAGLIIGLQGILFLGIVVIVVMTARALARIDSGSGRRRKRAPGATAAQDIEKDDKGAVELDSRV